MNLRIICLWYVELLLRPLLLAMGQDIKLAVQYSCFAFHHIHISIVDNPYASTSVCNTKCTHLCGNICAVHQTDKETQGHVLSIWVTNASTSCFGPLA